MFLWALAAHCYASSIEICSFNVQFLGNSKRRDNQALTAFVAQFDIVLVQELVAPPYPGKYPDRTPFKPDDEARQFFDAMKKLGFSYVLSEEDTGPGVTHHKNTFATEWFVAFFKANKVSPATDLPGGFLSKSHTQNPDWDRVPFAFPFRTLDKSMDFVLISVHLRPGPGKINRERRKHELGAINDWVKEHNQKEQDFIILGDMNIENGEELALDIPGPFNSLNKKCVGTNTNVNHPKPYDHVMFRPLYTREIVQQVGFKVLDLVKGMEKPWKRLNPRSSYPGFPVYSHDLFRAYYSDHHPVWFRMNSDSGDDD